jgi:IS30 family transposase
MRSYQHFTLSEREKLAEKLKEGKGIRKIAREMGVCPSRISREVKRNSSDDGSYYPVTASVNYLTRRKNCRRTFRIDDLTVKDFVEKSLDQYWSPEIITARFKMENKGAKLSHSTIYRAIKDGKLEKRFTAKTHLRRHGKRKNAHNTATIKPDHKIADRLEIINERGRIGDLEGDTVYGSPGKGAALTLIDRKARILYGTLLENRKSDVLEEGFDRALPENALSATLDNGSEFANHQAIAKNHNITIYFADPHSPWQRGSNENINGLLRFFFPKGTNFLEVTEAEFQKVISLINNRPRKCLGWLSPLEFFSSKCCA